MTNEGISSKNILRIEDSKQTRILDYLVVEEPLEIKLGFGALSDRKVRTLSITMRTPGQDQELVHGFLLAEGIIRSQKDILQIKPIVSPDQTKANVVLAELAPRIAVDFDRLDRHFYTTSSCGICGKTSIERVKDTVLHYPLSREPQVAFSNLYELPEKMREAQSLFASTGGIHAACLFNKKGEIIAMREDVGRHNALDKLAGVLSARNLLPAKEHILLVSGRLSFELVQKAVVAGIPVLAAVGAPSSLAVELAEAYNLTLVGFLKNGRFNVYCGEERIEEQGVGI